MRTGARASRAALSRLLNSHLPRQRGVQAHERVAAPNAARRVPSRVHGLLLQAAAAELASHTGLHCVATIFWRLISLALVVCSREGPMPLLLRICDIIH